MNPRLILFSAPLLLCLALPAQGVVSPRHFAGAEGHSYSTNVNAHIGSTSTPARYLQVHDDMAGNGRTINSIAFRRDGLYTTSNFASYSIVIDLFLSTATTTAGALDTTFDNNHGADKTRVAVFQMVQFPATTHGDLPHPFLYKIPFSTPFIFGGKGPLCWEVLVQSRQNTSIIYHDSAISTGANPALRIATSGSGCKSSGNTSAISYSASSTMNWTTGSGTLSLSGSRYPKSSAALITIGISNKSYGGVPLPFEIPSSKGASSGTCYLYCDMLLAMVAFTTSSGGLSSVLAVPATVAVHGFTVYTQALAPDPAANPIGLATSPLVLFNFCYPDTLPTVGALSLGGSTGATGTAYANRGLIARFE